MDTDYFFRIEAELDHISLVLGLNGHMDKCEEVEKIHSRLIWNNEDITEDKADKKAQKIAEKSIEYYSHFQ